MAGSVPLRKRRGWSARINKSRELQEIKEDFKTENCNCAVFLSILTLHLLDLPVQTLWLISWERLVSCRLQDIDTFESAHHSRRWNVTNQLHTWRSPNLKRPAFNNGNGNENLSEYQKIACYRSSNLSQKFNGLKPRIYTSNDSRT